GPHAGVRDLGRTDLILEPSARPEVVTAAGDQTLRQGRGWRGAGGGDTSVLRGGDESLQPGSLRLRSVDRAVDATMQRAGQVAGSRHPVVGGAGRRGGPR